MYLIRNGPDYLSPITPKNSLLLMLDYHKQQENRPNFSRLIALCSVVYDHEIPVILSSCEGNELSPALLMIGKPTFVSKRRTLNALAECDIYKTMERQKICKLIVASASAGAVLTRTALHGLRENYDVYVVWDACLERDVFEVDIARDRLTQAGVIPTSIRAMMSEITDTFEPLIVTVDEEIQTNNPDFILETKND